MNTFLFLSALIAAAAGADLLHAGSYIVRAPAHDSASIEHHRLGGNFAYSTAEAPAFAEVTPQISTITHPVAETTHTHYPAPIATHQPAPIIQTHHVAQPIFKDVPIHQTFPVTGPVRTHQTVHQPIVHETRTHHVQQSVHTAAVPAVATVAHEVPVAVAGYAGHAGLVGAGYAGHAGLVGAGYAGHGLVGAGYAGHGLIGAGYAGHGLAIAAE
jgi:hypothetical protein